MGFDVEDIEAARASLVAGGAEPLTEIKGTLEGSNRWCYLRDPEGNVFEITQRRRAAPDAS